MRELAEGLWVEDRRFRVLGLEVGTRMTVVRLEDGSLFLHSPVALDAELRAELSTLGPIRHVVAPNLHHHVHLGEYTELPQVRLYAPSDLPAKRSDIHFDAELTDEPPDAWRGQIDQHCFQGAPYLQEVAFFHSHSGTLMLSDLAFNFVECEHGPTRAWLWLMGALGRFGPPRHVRWLIRDKLAARRSAEMLLSWDIQRVVVAHGVVLQQSARRVLREAFSFLPG